MNKMMIISAVAGVCVSCTAQDSAVGSNDARISAEYGKTIKPGAAVRFTHSLRNKLSPGGDGVLTVTINEAYDEGVLALTASSDGLEVFATSSSTRFSMDGAERHIWDIYFTAKDPGVHYVNIHAAAQKGGAPIAMRSYAAAVQVGDASARKTEAQGEMMLNTDGESIIVMEAEEVIED